MLFSLEEYGAVVALVIERSCRCPSLERESLPVAVCVYNCGVPSNSEECVIRSICVTVVTWKLLGACSPPFPPNFVVSHPEMVMIANLWSGVSVNFCVKDGLKKNKLDR